LIRDAQSATTRVVRVRGFALDSLSRFLVPIGMSSMPDQAA